MNYEIYRDDRFGTPWGSFWTDYSVLRVDIPISEGSGQVLALYSAELFSGQTSAPPGTYTAEFASYEVDADYEGYTTTPEYDCEVYETEFSTHFSFRVMAVAEADCTLSATDIDFGDLDLAALRTGSNSTGVITTTCTMGSSYTLTMDAGMGAGATPQSRSMSLDGGGGRLDYNLYTDGGRTQIWGDGSGSSATVGGTGTGTATSHTVYARVQPQSTRPTGRYHDRVVVTVTY